MQFLLRQVFYKNKELANKIKIFLFSYKLNYNILYILPPPESPILIRRDGVRDGWYLLSCRYESEFGSFITLKASFEIAKSSLS